MLYSAFSPPARHVIGTTGQALAAGGALYVSVASGRLSLSSTQFVNNSAGERGGAVSLESVSQVSAQDLLLEDNEAHLGVVRGVKGGGGRCRTRLGWDGPWGVPGSA